MNAADTRSRRHTIGLRNRAGCGDYVINAAALAYMRQREPGRSDVGAFD